MFKQSSFRGFSDAYNYMYAKNLDRRFRLNYKRLIEVFFCYEILKFFSENNRRYLECNILNFFHLIKYISNKNIKLLRVIKATQ